MLVNYLVVHSELLFLISAARFLHRHGELDLSELHVDVALPPELSPDCENINLVANTSPSASYLPARFGWRFLFKMWSHRLCRLSTWRRSWNTRCVIRAYVETTEKFHPEVAEHSVVFTYPFRTRFRRQLRYWLRSFRKRRPVYRMGLPYRLSDCWKLLGNMRQPERALVEIEVAAHRRHAEELKEWSFAEVYSDSESETGGWALNRMLGELGLRTINHSHGVGVYGPFIWFDHCRFYCPGQREYYKPFARLGTTDLLRQEKSPARTRETAAAGDAARAVALILLQGNWAQAGKVFEADFESAVAVELGRIGRESGIPFFVRFHPNESRRRRRELARAWEAKELDEQDSAMATFDPVIVNMLSSSCYQYLHSAPVIFVRHQLQDPRIVFGPGITTVSLHELGGQIGELLAPAARRRQVALQTCNAIENACPAAAPDGLAATD